MVRTLTVLLTAILIPLLSPKVSTGQEFTVTNRVPPFVVVNKVEPRKPYTLDRERFESIIDTWPTELGLVVGNVKHTLFDDAVVHYAAPSGYRGIADGVYLATGPLRNLKVVPYQPPPKRAEGCPCKNAPGGVGTCGSYLCPANDGKGGCGCEGGKVKALPTDPNVPAPPGYQWIKRGDGPWKLEPTTNAPEVAVPKGATFRDAHDCPQCGRRQTTVDGFNRDGTHRHRCPVDGSVWSHK